MDYPDSFKRKCLWVYPHWVELHQKLEQGATIVGRYLGDCERSIKLEAVENATSLDELKSLALHIRAKMALYEEWSELYTKQFPPKY